MDEILSLETFLPYRLNRLADAVSRAFAEGYRARLGLTRPEWRTLATLGQFGTVTATEVGAHSSMHKTKVSRAVAALEARHWLTRKADSADRRIEWLSLTKAGQKVYAEMVAAAKSFEAGLLERMHARERDALLAGLAALERAALTD